VRKHRSYPIEFKRQVAQEYLAGETLHRLAKRHEVSRNLVRIWVAKYEAGSFDSDPLPPISCGLRIGRR
jgi:transposase